MNVPEACAKITYVSAFICVGGYAIGNVAKVAFHIFGFSATVTGPAYAIPTTIGAFAGGVALTAGFLAIATFAIDAVCRRIFR